MKMSKFKNIMTKILVLILAISLLENFLLVFMSYRLSKNLLQELSDTSSLNNIKSYSKVISNWLDERANEINVYANSPTLSDMNWNNIEPYLEDEISSKLNIYDHFIFADTSGNYRATPDDAQGNISNRRYFQSAMQGQLTISDTLVSKITGNQVIVIAAPVKDRQGKVVAVLGGSINLVKLSKIIESFNIDANSSKAFIIDKSGMIIAHPQSDYIMHKNIFTEPDTSVGQILKSDLGSVKYPSDGVESLNYYTTIPGTDGWKVIISVPVLQMETPIRYVSHMLMLIGIFGIMVSLLLGIFISRSISNPIIQLKNVFAEAAEGNLNARAQISCSDEIGEAAQGFNKMMDTITHMTFYDTLTDLPNKMLFNDRLNLELARAASENEKIALMILDIDRFEHINNAFGHNIGDKLLKSVVERMQGFLKKGELISRMGEDKFILLFTNEIHEKKIIHTAQNLLHLMKQSWAIDSKKIYITASIGIAFFPGDGRDGENLIKNAYSALQRAKRAGRDNYQLYDPSSTINLAEQIALDNSMRSAIEDNEFVIYYQPQVDTKTDKVIGTEALLRWQHPELGMVSPAKFIPIAEENGLIIPIGEWVLKTACAQNKKWQDAGYDPIYVSVNISSIQMRQPDFIDMIRRTLESTGLEPQYLELEITESIAMENTEYRIQILNELKNMGIRIAIDDFGTGYSSLNYLKNFNITTLKIDQSFVRDLTRDDKDAAIVSTILAIGHNLNLHVTAEGVETKEQLEFLRNKDCDIIQGYFYSRPVPAEVFEATIIGRTI